MHPPNKNIKAPQEKCGKVRIDNNVAKLKKPRSKSVKKQIRELSLSNLKIDLKMPKR